MFLKKRKIKYQLLNFLFLFFLIIELICRHWNNIELESELINCYIKMQ